MNIRAGFDSSTRFALTIPIALLCLAAQGSELSSYTPDAGVWRFSVDQTAYTIQTVDGHLIISPVKSGAVSADLPIKTNKKGRESVMGQWQNGAKEGFISIKEMSTNRISAFLFVPLDVLQPNACRTRTAAFLANMAAANEHRIVCGSMTVNWIRDQDVTTEQAAQQEENSGQAQTYAAGPIASAYLQPGAASNAVSLDPSLIGTWERTSGDRYNPAHVVISLNSDGSYDKTLNARLGGAGVGAVGGSERGTWSSAGSIVYTSGDGTHTPYQLDMRTFTRTQ